MTWVWLTLIFLLILFFLLFMGQWVAFALGTTGLIGLLILGRAESFQALGILTWNAINSYELTAIPLYILMGEIMLHSGLSDKFFKGASMWLNRIKGGLLQTNIVSCAIFAAVSGSSPATAATIGSVSYPEMRKRGYDKKMIMGSLGGGGALGILVPPSIIMLIYAAVVEVSIGKLFLAGVIPSLIAVIIFMSYIAIRCTLDKSLEPQEKEKTTFKQKMLGLKGVVPFIILLITVLGGIYFGIMTPTEAAAIGVVMATIISFVTKSFKWINFNKAIKSTVKTTCMIFFIIIGAKILTYLIVQSEISRRITEWVVELNPSLPLFISLVVIIYLILGMFIEGVSMIFITVPILLPILEAMQVDLIWFGIMLVILIEVSLITPPVGINLYVLDGIGKKDSTLNDVILGNVPYFFLYLLLVLIVYLIPEIALWLPSNIHPT